MKKIAIIGSGGLGREVLGIIQSINNREKVWDFIGFYDDNLSDDLVNGYPIVGKIEALNNVDEELNIVFGIGNPKVKEIISNKINNGNIQFPTLIHPSVEIYSKEFVSLGKGVVIGANSVLTVNINIADFVYINTASIIAHDVSIGKFTMIMPTTSISAGGEIGEKVYVGNGTKIDYHGFKIDDNSIIKAGSIISK